MSYLTLTKIAADPTIILRTAACAAAEGIPDPQFWAQEHMWQIVTQPGWSAAWNGSDSGEPGADEEAITDAMILHAVQAVNGQEATP